MAEQLFLSSGPLEGLRESGSFGQPLHTLYPQLKTVLDRELGGDDAGLLAEPSVDVQRNRIDWYTQGTTKPVALSSLPENQRQQMHDRLVAAYDRLESLADRYQASGHAGRIQLGTALKAALVPPADANVYLVDDRLVVTSWGFFQDRDWGRPMDLTEWRARYRRESQPEAQAAATPQAPIPVVAPEDTSQSQPVPPAPPAPPAVQVPQPEQPSPSPIKYYVVVGSRFFWGVWMVALVLLGLAIALYAGGLLPFERVASARGDLSRARQTEAELRIKLAQLRDTAMKQRAQCTGAHQSPPGRATDSAKAPPAMLTPSTATPEDRRRFDERLTEAGAEAGEITISLLWNNKNDLDLVVVCPSGKLLYFNNPSECGGTLDVDRNVSNLTDRPVENIYWPAGKAPAGAYQVAVKYYARQDTTIAAETAFQVQLVKDGQTLLFKGTVVPDEMKPVTEFTVER